MMKPLWVAAFLVLCIVSTNVEGADDALPSWNDGSAKQAMLEFVRATTDRSNPKFVPSEERIAVFDQDGTLWVEHPVYTQVVYCLDRVPALVAHRPELRHIEPFKTVLSGEPQTIAKLTLQDLEKILAATLTGETSDEFQAKARKWLASARDRRWQRPYTELVYEPMLEVLHLFRANGYKTYIVTGGGQDFVRVYSELRLLASAAKAALANAAVGAGVALGAARPAVFTPELPPGAKKIPFAAVAEK